MESGAGGGADHGGIDGLLEKGVRSQGQALCLYLGVRLTTDDKNPKLPVAFLFSCLGEKSATVSVGEGDVQDEKGHLFTFQDLLGLRDRRDDEEHTIVGCESGLEENSVIRVFLYCQHQQAFGSRRPEIGDQVYWPLRFGIGLSAVNTYNDQTLMQGRLDLLGVAFQYGHLLFEVSLPSVRFHSEFDQYGLWGWLFNISGAYVI